MRRRRLVALAGLAVILGVLLWGDTGLPGFGRRIGAYGRIVDAVAQAQRHVTNFVSAVTFDYRGVDTMVEEFILFASVIGVALLLRSSRDVREDRPQDRVRSDAIRTAGRLLAPVLLLVGLWVVSYGYITPGGGFQGGVIGSGAALLVWATASYRVFRRTTPTVLVDAAEGLGAASYVGIGLLGLASGAAFLSNVIPHGTAGSLASGGTIAALNWVTGVEVAGALVVVYHELLEEYVETLRRRDRAGPAGRGGR